MVKDNKDSENSLIVFGVHPFQQSPFVHYRTMIFFSLLVNLLGYENPLEKSREVFDALAKS